MSEVKELRKAIFNMLNYANMYTLVLDESMLIKFANNSLAKELGFKTYHEVLGRCWLDFIAEEDQQNVTVIHSAVSTGSKDWYEKYHEYINDIVTVNGKRITVHWFNSYINSDYNWTFSFGIRKNPPTVITGDSIRRYYEDIIKKDRTMINSLKDMITFRDKLNDSCQPNFLNVKD